MHTETLESKSSSSEPAETPKIVQVEKRRWGAAWEAWEDRTLAKQVLADDPILNKTGGKEDRWREVAEHLKKLVGIDRSWSSCKDRMDKLVGWLRVSSQILYLYAYK